MGLPGVGLGLFYTENGPPWAGLGLGRREYTTLVHPWDTHLGYMPPPFLDQTPLSR